MRVLGGGLWDTSSQAGCRNGPPPFVISLGRPLPIRRRGGRNLTPGNAYPLESVSGRFFNHEEADDLDAPRRRHLRRGHRRRQGSPDPWVRREGDVSTPARGGDHDGGATGRVAGDGKL